MPSKHTSGPWMTLPDEADKPYVRIRGSVAGSRFKIANVLKPIYKDPPEWEEEETRANVRLIEAAPDLLAAVEGLKQIIELAAAGKDDKQFVYLESRRGTFIKVTDALIAAEQAIAKATGT